MSGHKRWADIKHKRALSRNEDNTGVSPNDDNTINLGYKGLNRKANGYSLEDDLRQQNAILVQEVCELRKARRRAAEILENVNSNEARQWMSENAHRVSLNTARKPEEIVAGE